MFQKFGIFLNGAVLVVCGLVISGCAVNTATYGTGQTAGGALAKDIGSIATFGFIEGSDKKEQISYQERPPLAVPSKEGFKVPPRPIRGVSENQVSLTRDADAFEREYLADLANKPALTPAERLAEEKALLEQQLLEEQQAKAELLENPDGKKGKKKSLFRRVIGKSTPKTKPIGTPGALTEVPSEYRVVDETLRDDPLAKKKKKKRFLIF